MLFCPLDSSCCYDGIEFDAIKKKVFGDDQKSENSLMGSISETFNGTIYNCIDTNHNCPKTIMCSFSLWVRSIIQELAMHIFC